MRPNRWFLTLVLFAAAVAPARAEPLDAAEQLQQRFIEIAKKVGPAVVSISTETTERVAVRRIPFGGGSPFSEFDDDLFERFFRDFYGDSPQREFKQRGLGTGVIIDAEGLILTNEHVVHGADKVTVTLPDGREFKGEIKGTDPRSDLAVVRIEAKDLPAAELGDSGQTKAGQWAIAVGNPFGWAVGGTEPTITVGVVSALHRSIRLGGDTRDYSDLIQTDAAINPGNSGGPLVNLSGQVIGINVAIFSTTGGYQGIGFAIPVNVAKGILGDLIHGKKVLYGWLGVSVQDITEELKTHFKLSSQEGVIVARVMEGSPAEKGGLKDGDVVVALNGQPVKNVRELLRDVARLKVKEQTPMTVIRSGQQIQLNIEIGERPQEETELRGRKNWRGLEVAALTPEIAQRLGLGRAAEGVVISNIEPGSPAEEAGLEIGEPLFEINRQPVRSVKEFVAEASKAKGDALIKTPRGYFVLREAAPKE